MIESLYKLPEITVTEFLVNTFALLVLVLFSFRNIYEYRFQFINAYDARYNLYNISYRHHLGTKETNQIKNICIMNSDACREL